MELAASLYERILFCLSINPSKVSENHRYRDRWKHTMDDDGRAYAKLWLVGSTRVTKINFWTFLTRNISITLFTLIAVSASTFGGFRFYTPTVAIDVVDIMCLRRYLIIMNDRRRRLATYLIRIMTLLLSYTLTDGKCVV